MGYDSHVSGQVIVFPPLNTAEVDYLTRFSRSRRMSRISGPYTTPDFDLFTHDPDIIAFNTAPDGQPSVNCSWQPTADGSRIESNGNKNFYDPDDWIRYLIDTFLRPGALLQQELTTPVPQRYYDGQFASFTFGHLCNGQIDVQGEVEEDRWRIVIENNSVRTVRH